MKNLLGIAVAGVSLSLLSLFSMACSSESGPAGEADTAPDAGAEGADAAIVNSATQTAAAPVSDGGRPKPPDGGGPKGDGGAKGSGAGSPDGFGKTCTADPECSELFPKCAKTPAGASHCSKACTVATEAADCPEASSGCGEKGFCKVK